MNETESKRERERDGEKPCPMVVHKMYLQQAACNMETSQQQLQKHIAKVVKLVSLVT